MVHVTRRACSICTFSREVGKKVARVFRKLLVMGTEQKGQSQITNIKDGERRG